MSPSSTGGTKGEGGDEVAKPPGSIRELELELGQVMADIVKGRQDETDSGASPINAVAPRGSSSCGRLESASDGGEEP